MVENGFSPELEEVPFDPAIDEAHRAKTEKQLGFETNLRYDLGDAGVITFAGPDGLKLKDLGPMGRWDDVSLQAKGEGSIEELRRKINQANAAEVQTQKDRGKTIQPLETPDFEFKQHAVGPHVIGDEFRFHSKPGTFVMGNADELVGLQKPENVDLRAEFGIPLASAFITITTEKDGTRNFIGANRSGANASYRLQLGASIAGTNEEAPQDRDPATPRGQLMPLTNESATRFIVKEMGEEIGIPPETVAGGLENGMIYTGLGIDKRRVHLELVGVIVSSEDAATIKQRADENSQVERGAFDFAEDAIPIKAKGTTIEETRNNLEKLLTMDDSPVPPTHRVAYLSAARYLIMEDEGAEAADAWVEMIVPKMKEASERIDKRVRTATNDAEHRYNPRMAPEDQGLLPAKEALNNVDLLVSL